MKYSIPLTKPHLIAKDLKNIEECFKSSWISSKSKYVKQFEIEFAKRAANSKYALAVNSGTSALFLSLKSLNINPSDEVIIPTFTMISTINSVVWAGAKPVLVDCQSKDDWNINVDQIIKKITPHTKAIIPVHIYGYPCNMDAIIKIAKQHNLYIIEDAAEALGSLYRGKLVGGIGDLACFSLYSNKIITTGNGGIITTSNTKFYNLIKKIRFFDFNAKSHFLHHIIGYNLVLSGLQASLGLSQLQRVDELISKRRLIFSWYYSYLKDNPLMRFLPENQDIKPNYWFPAVIFKNPAVAKNIQQKLTSLGIETRIFFRPLHRQPLYSELFKNQQFPNADYFWKHGLLLPSFYELTKEDIYKISRLLY